MTVYVVGPMKAERGLCRGCGCRLQRPYRPETEGGEWGTIWLTPWHDHDGICTVCLAHREDAGAIEELHHWLLLNSVQQTNDDPNTPLLTAGTSNETIGVSFQNSHEST